MISGISGISNWDFQGFLSFPDFRDFPDFPGFPWIFQNEKKRFSDQSLKGQNDKTQEMSSDELVSFALVSKVKEKYRGKHDQAFTLLGGIFSFLLSFARVRLEPFFFPSKLSAHMGIARHQTQPRLVQRGPIWDKDSLGALCSPR